MDCPQTRDMPEKNEDDWINTAICFYQRTLPQLHSCCGWGTIRVEMPTEVDFCLWLQ